MIKPNYKMTLPASIVIASLALGGFFYASQTNKQRSIERQQQVKIEQERQREQSLDTCIANAEEFGKLMKDGINITALSPLADDII
jgi:hypothetical protein